MNTLRSKLAPLAAVALIAPAAAGCGYNTLPTQDQDVKGKWAQVQNEYQRRANLIPNLVATVKGQAAQEKSVLVGVAQARAAATQVTASPEAYKDPAEFQRYVQAQNNLSASIMPLRVLQENYPDLKSNEAFMALQSQLEGTENRITIARKDYNNSAQKFNTSLVTFPSLLWAKTAQSNLKSAQMFQADAGAQTAPSVSFDATAPSVPPAPVTPAGK